MRIFNQTRKGKSTDIISSESSEEIKNEDNPYLAARRTWNEHIGGVVSSRQTWQVLGILSMLIALSAVGGIVMIGKQSKFIPLVVREDAQKNIISVSRADKIGAAQATDYAAAAVNFFENVRLVTPDVEMQRKAVFRAYSALNGSDPATLKTNEYLNGTEDASPFKRASKETVSFQLKSALKQTETTWQVEWVETVRDRQGATKGKPYVMRALVTLYQAEPNAETKEEDIIKNPHLIFVRDFNWTKIS